MNNGKPQAMVYNYDQLSRIKGAKMYDNYTGATWGVDQNQRYDENFTYDANGNITKLIRNGRGIERTITRQAIPVNRQQQNIPDVAQPTTYTDYRMDELHYNYDITKNNQLLHINDSLDSKDTQYKNFYNTDIDDQGIFAATSPNYQYDAIGNLVSDKSEGININWNREGKVQSVIRKARNEKEPDIYFEYDAMGNRIVKRVIYPEPYIFPTKALLSEEEKESIFIEHIEARKPISFDEYYVRDASGNVIAIYERRKEGTVYRYYLKELSLYGSSRLGVIDAEMKLIKEAPCNCIMCYKEKLKANAITTVTMVPKDTINYKRVTGAKRYELGNHLGNVNVVISDRKVPVDSDGDGAVDWYGAEVVSAVDYYAFGAIMPGKNFNATDYRFGYNGKENDNEILGNGNSQDFGARMYDNRLCRWKSGDPLAVKYPFASPYNFALNTPIQAYDPDGKLVIFVNGYRLGSEGKKELLDTYGFARRFSRWISGEKIYSVDKFNYWGKIDNKFIERIGDKNVVYADASSHAISGANYRYERGQEAGEAMLKKINAGEIKLQTDENGNVTETIKIVSHSQGPAYASGMSKVLTDAGYKVEVEYDIAPKQAGDILETKADRRVQYGSDEDMIAPQEKMQGTVEQGGPPEKEGPVEGHMLENFKNIFNIGKGKDGYVAPRKDVQENGGGILGIIMLLTIFLGGCKNKEEQLKCLEEQIVKYKEDKEYQNLKIALADSIKKWSHQGLKNMISYNDSNSTWKIDEIIFNEDRSKLFGWLLQIDKEQVADIPANEDRDDILDYVEYFTGEKRNGQWYFYVQYMPRIWFAREDNNSKPYSFEYLSERAKAKVVEGGIFKKGTCDMSYNYINEWIDKEGEGVRYKWHQEFLKTGDSK